jgi:polar amino acid transport system permease protein
MNYVFQFGIVWDHFDRLIAGTLVTARLSVCAFLIGLCLAGVLAYFRSVGPRWGRALVIGYVEFIRNTPFLIQLFVAYFSLPAVGIRLQAEQAALLTMVVNFSGYAVEILRAGVEAIPRGQIEAGESMGLSKFRIYRHVILFPAVKTVYPALASQFILLMLGSSLIAAISVEDLTGVTNSLQSTTFRAFEFYFVATAIYLGLAAMLRLSLDALYWAAFLRGYPRTGREGR